MNTYICHADGGVKAWISADSAEGAAEKYAEREHAGLTKKRLDVYVQRNPSKILEILRAATGDLDIGVHDTGWLVYGGGTLDLDTLRAALPHCVLAVDDDGDLDVDHGLECEVHTFTWA